MCGVTQELGLVVGSFVSMETNPIKHSTLGGAPIFFSVRQLLTSSMKVAGEQSGDQGHC